MSSARQRGQTVTAARTTRTNEPQPTFPPCWNRCWCSNKAGLCLAPGGLREQHRGGRAVTEEAAGAPRCPGGLSHKTRRSAGEGGSGSPPAFPQPLRAAQRAPASRSAPALGLPGRAGRGSSAASHRQVAAALRVCSELGCLWGASEPRSKAPRLPQPPSPSAPRSPAAQGSAGRQGWGLGPRRRGAGHGGREPSVALPKPSGAGAKPRTARVRVPGCPFHLGRAPVRQARGTLGTQRETLGPREVQPRGVGAAALLSPQHVKATCTRRVC